MSKEYIEKEAALEFPKYLDREHGNKHFIWGVETYAEYLQGLPPADVKPVVRGEWSVTDVGYPELICSSCQVHIPFVAGWCMDAHMNFCPNCGSDMRKEANDER